MKKTILMFGLLLFCCSITYASPVVKATSIRIEEERMIIPSNYDSTCNVLDNSITVYMYKDRVIARVNTPHRIVLRAKIGEKWYILPQREFFGLY